MILVIVRRILTIFHSCFLSASVATGTVPALPPQRQLTRLDRPIAYLLGTTRSSGLSEPVVIPESATLTHALLIGRTGSGKSKLAQAMTRDLIRFGRGFGLVDPKRRFIDDVLADIAKIADETGNDAILKRVILIELTPTCVPLLSAMKWEADPSIPEHLQDQAKRIFFAKEADVLLEIIHRNEEESEAGHPRIKRILRDIFVALAMIGLEFGDALVLLDLHHSRHQEVWAKVRDSAILPEEVRADLEAIHALKREQDIMAQLEGPINRMRGLLSPLIRQAFLDALASIDFSRALRNRQIILVRADETKYVSRFQAKALGGIVIHRLVEAAASEDPREQDERAPFPIFIDEAQEQMSHDLDRLLRMGRSMRTPVFLMAQTLSAFEKNDEMDFRNSVINECGLTCIFQSKTCEEDVVNLLAYGGLLDFTRATREVDRPDGFDLLVTPSVSVSHSQQQSKQRGGSLTRQVGTTRMHGTDSTLQDTYVTGYGESEKTEKSLQDAIAFQSEVTSSRSRSSSETDSQQYSITNTTGKDIALLRGRDMTSSAKQSRSATKNATQTSGMSSTFNDQEVHGSGTSFSKLGGFNAQTNHSQQTIQSFADNQSSATTTGETESDEIGRSRMERCSVQLTSKESQSEGSSLGSSHALTTGRQWGEKQGVRAMHTDGVVLGIGRSTKREQATGTALTRRSALSRTSGRAEGENWSSGISIGEGETVGYRVGPVARHRTEVQTLPQLQTAIEDQKAMIMTELSIGLGIAECFVRVDAQQRTVRMKVRHVAPAYDNPREFYDAIERIKAKLRTMHAFMRSPDLSVESEHRRIDQFLRDFKATPLAHLPASENDDDKRPASEETGPLAASDESQGNQHPFR